MQVGKTSEERDQAREKAYLVTRGSHLTDERKRNIAAGEMKPRLTGRFDLCRICGGITCTEKHSGHEKQRQTHLICLQQYQRGHQGSRVGRSVRAAYPPSPEGRLPSPEDLAASYELCVRHLLKKEPIGEERLKGGTGLAAEFGLSRDGIRGRIRVFLRRLPSNDVGGKGLARRAKALLEAARNLGYNI